METLTLTSWQELRQWSRAFNPEEKKFAFRGQADSRWRLKTSLARYFLDHHVEPDEWRKRELRMYCSFRRQLLDACPGMYGTYPALDILSLMQHHHAPTRLLDFSYDPNVAAFFALEDSRDESAIYVVDCNGLARRRKQLRLRAYCGPTHAPVCSVFQKDDDGQYLLVGSILQAKFPHGRLVAQRGCFFVPGSISEPIREELVKTKVTLPRALVNESLEQLKAEGYARDTLFPDLDRIAGQAKRIAVYGGSDCACAQVGNG